jgi:hypothetical protein
MGDVFSFLGGVVVGFFEAAWELIKGIWDMLHTLWGVLILIALIAGVIAGAVLLLTDAGQNTDPGELIKQELNEQIQKLEDFIQENTQ